MTMQVQQKVNTADTAVTRTDVVHLLEEVGSPEQLDVSGQNLRGIDLLNFNLKGANISHARICEANLCGANLSEADLHGADLSGTYLCWADLRGANLSEADLREANLIWADLRGADLRGVQLDMATLYGAELSWATLGGRNTFELTRSHLRRRGAIFREKTDVIVTECFSEKAGRYAQGFALGLLFMSVVGFLMGLGIKGICSRMRLNGYPGNGLLASWDQRQGVAREQHRAR
jgi:Pentapeptide repeats (8 copies)